MDSVKTQTMTRFHSENWSVSAKAGVKRAPQLPAAPENTSQRFVFVRELSERSLNLKKQQTLTLKVKTF